MSVQSVLIDTLEVLKDLEAVVSKAEKRKRTEYMPVVKWRGTKTGSRLKYMALTVEAVLERYKREAERVSSYRPGGSRHRTI